MANAQEICARLCLLTHAAWEVGLPPPLSRPMMYELLRSGALCGDSIKDTDTLKPELLNRAHMLLLRRRRVMDCMEAYRALGYEILLPEDVAWPERLSALGTGAPPFLFARGNIELLSRRKVAVAGSRVISSYTASLSRHLGQRLAAEGFVMVSGGAQGVDTAAHKGALEVGGSLVIVPAQPVEKLLSDHVLSRALEEKRLLLVCDALPDDTFSPQKAITRNHTIYAMAEAAVVVASRSGVGGSWRGAVDCLRGGYTPVFAPLGKAEDMAGNAGLIGKGAQEIDLLAPLGAQMFRLAQTSLL